MKFLPLSYVLVGAVVETFLLLLVISSARERRHRAVLVSLAALVVIGSGWYGWYLLVSTRLLLLLPPVLVLIAGLLFYLPHGSSPALRVGEIDRRVDERDVMFSREEYEPGTERYESYYTAHPELKEVDDRMRRFPELFEPGGKYYEKGTAEAIDSVFDAVATLTTAADGPVSPDRDEVTPNEATEAVKRDALRLGADEVGIAVLNPMYVYSHVGRGPEPYGQPIVNRHRFAIMFTLEMDYYEVEQAPLLPITGETARQYLRGAEISIELARRIRSRGYPARAHIAGSNYQIMMPPVAHDAGLGELGRLGYLISPRFGPRIRLGGVTTDLPLVPDRPISFGVQDFCAQCLKCAINCPSGAIPRGDKTVVRGVEKWLLDAEKCIHYWRAIGTDCGLCMKVCPFSHPPTIVHNLVRAGCRRSSTARRLAVWADDLFYGRKLKLPGGPILNQAAGQPGQVRE